jgi:hypothetical protein
MVVVVFDNYLTNILLIIAITGIMYCIYKYIKRQFLSIKVLSEVDNRYYIVRYEGDTKKSADMLATINKNIQQLLHFISTQGVDAKYSKNIKLLKQRYNIDGLMENIELDNTTYTVNKGESIEFCLATRDSKQHMYDLNKLMFVTIHELAHIGCETFDHGPEFKSFFPYLLNSAIKCGVYKYQDYSREPEEYCGMTINHTPL